MSSALNSPPAPRRWWFVLMLALLGVVLAARAWCPLVGSDDFWAHAAVGRWIWQHGEAPRHTLFLWTASEPWVAHSWLGEVALFALLANGGTLLVQLAAELIIAAPFVLLFLLWRRHAPFSTMTIIAFGLAINASATRFEARPEAITGLLLTCLLGALVVWSTQARSPTMRQSLPVVIGLPALFSLWVNCHGQVANGLVLLAITAGCDLIQDRADRRSLILVLTTLLAAGAMLLNPYGIGYLEAYRVVNSATFATIREWQPFWAPPAMPAEVPLSTFGLVLLAGYAWKTNPARRWSQLAWLLFMTACFLRASRFVWMLNLTSLAVVAANAKMLDIEDIWRRWREPAEGKKPSSADAMSPRIVWLARAAVMLWLIFSLSEPLSRWWEVSTQGSTIVPRGIADFLEEKRPPGHIFNDYENSSYLHWRLGGDPPLFIDLLNAYPDGVMRDYRDIVLATDRRKQLLDDRDINVVVLTRYRVGLSLAALEKHLDDSPHWERVYAKEDGGIWVRRR